MTRLLLGLLALFTIAVVLAEAHCNREDDCSGHGTCINKKCVCYDGWQGLRCQYCGGKVRLTSLKGTIYDGPGNYPLETNCTWLIDAPNSTITLHLEDFDTECGWDHMYVYDGDSVDAPLLAALTGQMYKGSNRIRRVPEIVTKSGAALVQFFSDVETTTSGFNITYRTNACLSSISGVDCSGNGVCIEGVCSCKGNWTGNACHLEKCPGNCGSAQGRGTCEPEYGCRCTAEYKGEDCSQLMLNGYWESVQPKGYVPPGSASHGAAVWNDSLYVISGESFNKGSMLNIYDFKEHVWETTKFAESPPMRSGHSTVLYGGKLFLYGGDVDNRGSTSELWSFDIKTKSWENITVRLICSDNHLLCGPLRVSGHTATVVTNVHNSSADRMIVIFGHSPLLGYLNTVQEYYFGTREWHIVEPRGYPVKGGYGHSAAWDNYTEKIYVLGGMTSGWCPFKEVLSDKLYSYDPQTSVWTLLEGPHGGRRLHSATFVSPTLMLVFGGNVRCDGGCCDSKCYSAEMMAYDAICDTWKTIPAPEQIQSDLARIGHSATMFDGSLYIYGGFDGQMLSDIIRYRPGSCGHFDDKKTCLLGTWGVTCVWDTRNAKCMNITEIAKNQPNINGVIKCPTMEHRSNKLRIKEYREHCLSRKDCSSCVQSSRNCVWCSSGCKYKSCKNKNKNKNKKQEISTLDQCPRNPGIYCEQLDTCNACMSQSQSCLYRQYGKCRSVDSSRIATKYCPAVCAELTSCQKCTQENCLWCQNKQRCVDGNAYTTSFPYGQCHEWTRDSNKCQTGL